jgi:predicted aminopeptidase
MSYLLQAGRGQLALIQHARPIPEVLRDEKTPPRIRELLAEISAIKKYGEENGLKPTRNYTDYVKLNREAAVWVVSACESLRFRSKEWKFPIVGSFPYLGWFDLDGAKEFASELRAEGWDVDVRGARAYSTLGWFRDSILSSMIPPGPEALGELINVVLHESVHATIYIPGQAYFDESLASFVADRMTPVYLEKLKGARSPELEAYQRENVEGEGRQKVLHETYLELEKLYSSSLSDAEKAGKKKEILTGLKTRLQLKREINNATLIQFKEYHSGKQDFDGLFEACGRDWKRFLGAAAKLTEESFSKGQQEDLAPVLGKLAQTGC